MNWPRVFNHFRLVPACALAAILLSSVHCARSPTELVLEHELLKLRLQKDNRVSVYVRYKFRGRVPSSRRLVFPETPWFLLENFSTTWNGRAVSTRRLIPPSHSFFHVKGSRDDYTAMHAYRVPPSPGEVHIMENRYEYSPPYYGPGTKSANPDEPRGLYIEYILKTGATWRGPIGDLRVVFAPGHAPCDSIRSLPDSYAGVCDERGIWRFDARNLEPTKNIRLVITRGPASKRSTR